MIWQIDSLAASRSSAVTVKSCPYVHNNPINFVDPLGLWGWDGDWIQKGVGGLLGFYGSEVQSAGLQGAKGGATIVADTFTFSKVNSLHQAASQLQGAEYTASRVLATVSREALITAGTAGIGNAARAGNVTAQVAQKVILATESATGGYDFGSGINKIAEGNTKEGVIQAVGGALRVGGAVLNARQLAQVQKESAPLADSTAEVVKDNASSATKIHGNSLDSPKPAQGYSLRDRDTGDIMKYGETTRGTKRYSQKYLKDNNAEMVFEAEGTKREMHQWQHEKILDYRQQNTGGRPPLNKSDW